MSQSRYDVILVDVDPAYKNKLMGLLMEPAPYPNLSRENSAMALVRQPSVVVSCIDISNAVFLEMLIEMAGGSVLIRPAELCD